MNRIVVNNLSEMSGAIEASDFKGRIRLKEDSRENYRSLKLIARIMAGEVRPCRSFMAGNDYFGRVRFEYERPDLSQAAPKTYFLSAQVFSALGHTLAEHDTRYRRNKDLMMSAEYRQESGSW